jgi:hypothetical protein
MIRRKAEHDADLGEIGYDLQAAAASFHPFLHVGTIDRRAGQRLMPEDFA